MSLKKSTGLRNFLLGEGSLRKAFEDAVLYIYSGTAPVEADDAAGVSPLLKITKDHAAVAANARSTPSYYKITIAHAGDAPDVGDTAKLLVDDVAFEYAATASENTVEKMAVKVAQLLNDLPQVDAIPTHEDGILYVKSRFDGVNITITSNTPTGGLTNTVGTRVDAVAVNTLKLLASSSGAITKNTDTWSGVGLAVGTATHFRLITSSDTNADNQTELRIQGTVSTSGADLNLSNINITVGPTTTIDIFTLTDPAS